ncbi:hypothetical protein ABZS66_09525 [Dactylosporangium sp. NPDC005572]|uniref:hypothetical protein n=1 Tax=Dactylosporangium sp. NPDC005572 TaxID=3156889 RepID=UPI0033A90B6B
MLAVRWNGERQREGSDRVAREYFEALRRGDSTTARGLMCADADVEHARFETVSEFAIERAQDSGSPMDGSGRTYFVRLVLPGGATTDGWLHTEYTSQLKACVAFEERRAPTGRS